MMIKLILLHYKKSGAFNTFKRRYFKCDVLKYNSATGKVNEMHFQEVSVDEDTPTPTKSKWGWCRLENNISNALIIAGSILIGVLLVSLSIFTLRQSALFAKSYEDRNVDINLTIFNSKFEVYNRTNNTIQDVISCVNLARDENEKNGVDKNDAIYIKVKLNSKELQKYNDVELIQEMNSKNEEYIKVYMASNENKTLEAPKFKGIIEYDKDTGRVKQVTFKE